MSKVVINAKAQPEVVSVYTELTPEMFPASEAVVELKDENGKGKGFYFALSKLGEPQIKKDSVGFVGTKKGVKLVAQVPMKKFGNTTEEAAMALGDLVANCEALEAQIKADYNRRKTAAARVVVETEEEATAE